MCFTCVTDSSNCSSRCRFCFKFTLPQLTFEFAHILKCPLPLQELILGCFNVQSFAANLFYKLHTYLCSNSNHITDKLGWPSSVSALETPTMAKPSINYILVVTESETRQDKTRQDKTKIKAHTSGVASCRRKLGQNWAGPHNSVLPNGIYVFREDLEILES
jgi:hypothetical protein